MRHGVGHRHFCVAIQAQRLFLEFHEFLIRFVLELYTSDGLEIEIICFNASFCSFMVVG
jgi:hypothetical protein